MEPEPQLDGLLSEGEASALADQYVALKEKLSNTEDPDERAAIEAQVMVLQGDAAEASYALALSLRYKAPTPSPYDCTVSCAHLVVLPCGQV